MMKTQISYPRVVLTIIVFFIIAPCAFAQSLLSDNNISLISSGNGNYTVNNDKADEAGQYGDNGLYIFRPNYILGFSPFAKGFWKLSRFGYYNWVYNLSDYTLNSCYDYYSRGIYGGWLYGRMNIYGFNGWNYNQTQFYPAGYFTGLYGINGYIMYKPLIVLKNTKVNVPLTTANNFFFTRLFERNKLPAKYTDSFDDKPEKKPKPVNLSGMNSVPVVKTDIGSQREAKKINYYYKTKFDDYYNSLNRNLTNGNNKTNINSGIYGNVLGNTKKNTPEKVLLKESYSSSSVTGSATVITATNNQGSKSNSASNNSGSKQQNTGSTKK